MRPLTSYHGVLVLVICTVSLACSPRQTHAEPVPNGADPFPSPTATPLRETPFPSTTQPASINSVLNVESAEPTWKKLLIPNFKLATEWQAETNEIGVASYEAGVSLPVYPVFGPPPPFIQVGFTGTEIDAPPAAGLPRRLYQTDIGLAWMRRLNDRWMAQFMAGASFGTDGNNESSDAWRFRGGAFALYRRDPAWTWTLGAMALGRNDLPVVPAVGVIHQPHPAMRFDLIMPKPRVSFLLADRGVRQQWGYAGLAINGATWGVARVDSLPDQLTYGDFRAVIGWESTPTPEPGLPFTRGRKFGVEAGYVFSRDFEWEDSGSEIALDDTFLLRASASF